MAGLQIGDDIINRPAAKSAARIVGNVGREPTLQCVALQALSCLVAAKKILRRVAQAAMAETFGQIGAAIPFQTLVGDRTERPRHKEQHVPNRHGSANIERKWQLIRLHRVVHGRNRVEIGAERHCIITRELGIVGVGHGRIETCPVAAGAFGQCVDELVIGPGADAGCRIGRDIGRDEIAERHFDDTPAGEVVAAGGQRVAGGTIADDGAHLGAIGGGNGSIRHGFHARGPDARQGSNETPALCPLDGPPLLAGRTQGSYLWQLRQHIDTSPVSRRIRSC